MTVTIMIQLDIVIDVGSLTRRRRPEQGPKCSHGNSGIKGCDRRR